MFLHNHLTCDKCGLEWHGWGHTPPNMPEADGWLRHAVLGDYCPTCKAVVLA